MPKDWDELKREIYKETRKSLEGKLINDHLEVIETLKNFLLYPLNDSTLHLDGLETRVLNAMNKILVEGLSKKDTHSFFLEIAKLEPLLRKLLYLINPTEFTTLSASKKGLFRFIQVLNLNTSNIDFSNAISSAYTNDINLGDHLITVYKLRNVESHQCEEWTNSEMHSYVQSLLSIYLFTIDRYYLQIRSFTDTYFGAQQKDFTDYLTAIRASFENKMRRFVHIRGKEDFRLSEPSAIELTDVSSTDEEHIERKGTVVDLRDNQIPEKRMLLWGEAGLGKTTSMEYISYIDAATRLNDSSKPLPVYLALGLLTDKNITIKQHIFNKLEIDSDNGETLLQNGGIHLFLDGINEIPKDLNYSLKTIRHKEIQQLLNTYGNTFFILSNRPQDINEFKSIPVFTLQKMDEVQIGEFIEKNTEGLLRVKEKIANAIATDQRLFKIIKTPLMLSRFIEIVRTAGEIPRSEGEIIHHFLSSLYRREKEEKQDANFDIKKIHRMLRYLGYTSLEKYGTNSGMPEDEILNRFVACKAKYGFDIDTVYVLETVTQLNILERTGRLYTFAHQAYQDYYHSQEEQSIIDI